MFSTGGAGSRATAESQLKETVRNRRIKFICTLLLDGATGRMERPSAPGKPHNDKCCQAQLGAAATLIAAHSIKTAGFDPPSALQNFETVSEASSDCGKGIRGNRALPLAPRYAAMAARNGACVDRNPHIARHVGWFLEQFAPDEDFRGGVGGGNAFTDGGISDQCV